jgi:hypothetical protein
MLVRNADWDPDLRNTSAGIPDKMAVCVKPIHFNYNQVSTCTYYFINSFMYWHCSAFVFEKYFCQILVRTPTVLAEIFHRLIEKESLSEVETRGGPSCQSRWMCTKRLDLLILYQLQNYIKD